MIFCRIVNQYDCAGMIIHRKIVTECWFSLTHRYNHLYLGEWMVMPDHLHGIIGIRSPLAGASRGAPTMYSIKPLGELMGAFKTMAANRINRLRGTPGVSVRQRNYYERIIRNERELDTVREYIRTNPMRAGLKPAPTMVPKALNPRF